MRMKRFITSRIICIGKSDDIIFKLIDILRVHGQ